MKTKRQLKMFDKEEFRQRIRERIRNKIEEATETFTIPPELECLAEEARKYDSAEEFKKAFIKNIERNETEILQKYSKELKKGELRIESIEINKIKPQSFIEVPEEGILVKHPYTVSEKMVNEFIQKFIEGGEYPPLIVDENYNIIAGNHRLEALKRVGEKNVRVVKIDKTGGNLTDFYNRAIEESEFPEEECEDCKLSVGVGMALNVCKTLNYPDCDELYDKIMNGEVDADEVVDMLIKRAKKGKNKEEYDVLKEIKKVMHMPLSEVRELGE